LASGVHTGKKLLPMTTGIPAVVADLAVAVPAVAGLLAVAGVLADVPSIVSVTAVGSVMDTGQYYVAGVDDTHNTNFFAVRNFCQCQ